MATQRETTEFILEQLQGAGETRVQAMFGEYALYLDGKVLGFICDDTLFLKDTPGARALIDAPETGPAYPGSKPYLIGATLLDDPESLCAVARAIWEDLPTPKPRKPRTKR
ncbi:MAG: TfoX/Sxy family protein [Rhodobacter sp.]|nr:TfoX/Sxy family protein [Paracoccaceae bacterium]MCB1408845.1 TfoX/Sxy family protein [Paracoccaceae bacterium]MCC0081578.1 TfoX/Sxy family protein [Rhodobacter sp.]